MSVYLCAGGVPTKAQGLAPLLKIREERAQRVCVRAAAERAGGLGPRKAQGWRGCELAGKAASFQD